MLCLLQIENAVLAARANLIALHDLQLNWCLSRNGKKAKQKKNDD